MEALKKLSASLYNFRGKLMRNRFIIIKQFYNQYVVLIKRKEKYITFDQDTEILEYIKYKKPKDLNKKKINYLILDNLDIVKKCEYKEDNKYREYLLKAYIDKIIKKMRARIRVKWNESI